ncbi:MAG: EthD family reductase [Rhodanobacteraceae bacterium]
MIKVSILYPNIEGGRFDFEYYRSKHMPRSIELLGAHPGFRSVAVERGIGGTEPGSRPKYVAACFYVFESVDAFIAAFTPHAAELQADMQRYTDIPAEIQFNEILIDRRIA